MAPSPIRIRREEPEDADARARLLGDEGVYPQTLQLPQVRAAQAQMARHSLRAPKGVFIHDRPEQMDADRLRWTVERAVAVALGEDR